MTVGLSPEKAQKMKQALTNHRALERLIEEMREIAQKLLIHTPETPPEISALKHPKAAVP